MQDMMRIAQPWPRTCPLSRQGRTSWPHLFEDRLDDLAGEVRGLLASRSAEGIFWDWPGDTEVILARKPG
jgi:hypothetical protein